MSSNRFRGPLSESEKQWRDQFLRKLESLSGREDYQTAFLDPLQQELAETVLQGTADWSYTVYGGYPGAERACIRVFASGQQQELLPVVACLLVERAFSDERPSHRDYLGAVMALGLRRDQVGDIILLPGGQAAVMVAESKAAYICDQLTRVGDFPVECKLIDQLELSLPSTGDHKEITGTVASLRLDALLSLGFGLSRSRAALLIKGGLVRVNWRPVSSPACQLHEGDLLALQGRGRVELVSVQGETRKGRLRLRLKKFN